MIVVGGCLLPIFAAWDLRYTQYPVIPWRHLKNWSVVGASLIGFFDFVCAIHSTVIEGS
jgi:hypothetical protein